MPGCQETKKALRKAEKTNIEMDVCGVPRGRMPRKKINKHFFVGKMFVRHQTRADGAVHGPTAFVIVQPGIEQDQTYIGRSSRCQPSRHAEVGIERASEKKTK